MTEEPSCNSQCLNTALLLKTLTLAVANPPRYIHEERFREQVFKVDHAKLHTLPHRPDRPLENHCAGR
ncbi:hypothetical protein [Pseudomonas brassicacearum]|uniref:hypothetical protein n=1 Tax=Pseudomonas brassicacearum TaxID=930166 RepID=UPI0011CE6F38|nr:hypothetical protein [Pseudomonas brassicacearum]